ncbi:MAG: right-handed parallel beta-helix repeat-containing protein [Terracidiphilus sp.]
MAEFVDRLRYAALVMPFIVFLSVPNGAQQIPDAGHRQFFINCSAATQGDGSRTHPWNSLTGAEAHSFMPGDQIALARATVCRGDFSPHGSGTKDRPIRITAYGRGPRPRIVAPASDRQVLLLFNQQYWQIDSLDLSGANTYGIFVTGDSGTLHHIYLENLYVHDAVGGEMKRKDNGLVVVGPSSLHVFFSDILVDGVVAAHTNQWAGILIGGGPFPYKADAPLNSRVTVRNSSVHDVYGDGIVLFRDSNSVIETSTAWETGMQPTETIGTPNAIWTWTCTDCIVRDNEAFLTDSPGVDGGAYDIDWDNTRNTVERNYGHDTQGYCFAVFAAGYVTSESVVRDNLCVDNGQSPRLAALQGAAYLHSWNGGVLRGLRIEHNTFVWNPPVSSAAAIVDDAGAPAPVTFTNNRIDSTAPLLYRISAPFAPTENDYRYNGTGEAKLTLDGRHKVTLAALQQAGFERGTTLEAKPAPAQLATRLRLDASVDFALDADGLLAARPRAQLMVLRSLAAQYGAAALAVTVHLRVDLNSAANKDARDNALLDLDAGPIRFDYKSNQVGVIRLLAADGRLLEEWHGFQNAAALGGAVRARLGVPRFAQMR